MKFLSMVDLLATGRVVVLPHEILGSILYFQYSDEFLCINIKMLCYSDQICRGIKESITVKHSSCKFHHFQSSTTSNKLENKLHSHNVLALDELLLQQLLSTHLVTGLTYYSPSLRNTLQESLQVIWQPTSSYQHCYIWRKQKLLNECNRYFPVRGGVGQVLHRTQVDWRCIQGNSEIRDKPCLALIQNVTRCLILK